jgi:hypothetical protein
MFEHMPPVSEVDVLVSPDAVVAELATSVPRGDDTAALLLLDDEALSDAGRVDLLVAFERHIAMLQAAQQQVLTSLDGRALDWSGTKLVDYTREQVGAALRLSPGTAERRLAVARTLVDRLPATLDLLRAGRITYLHAMKLAEAVAAFDDQTTGKIEQRVLARAAERTLSQFGLSLRRAVIVADPRRAEQRHDDAVAQRRLVFTPQDDGITELWALLPADGAALIETVLNSLASGQTTPAAPISAAPTRCSTCSPGCWVTRTCPRPMGSGPPSTSPWRSAPCSATTSSPPSWTGTGPSAQPWPGVSPPTPLAPGVGWSPTAPVNSSTTVGAPTGHQRT